MSVSQTLSHEKLVELDRMFLKYAGGKLAHETYINKMTTNNSHILWKLFVQDVAEKFDYKFDVATLVQYFNDKLNKWNNSHTYNY